jgi:hypothetical protein
MKKFAIKLLYFSLPILIIAYPLDFVMSYYLRQSNTSSGEFEVWNDIYSSNANCDIAIYGSSRSWVHIDPQILSDSLNVKVYNFGIDGHNFWLQYLRHIEFLKHNEKPKTIILSVDVFSLQKRKDLYQLDQFLPYMLWNSYIQEYTSSYIGYNKFDYYLPLVRYSGKSNAISLINENIARDKVTNRYRQNGFLGMDREWNADLEKAKKGQKSYEINTDSNSIVLFEKFINECKANDIELIFVYTPEYIDGQNFVANRNDIIQIYRDLSTKYSIEFYDYSNDSLCLDKKYFYNASHLNKSGAEIFSKKLASDLKARTHNNVYKK